MIYFTLPNFFHNFKINNFFARLSIENKKYFKIPVAFSHATGNFPYCYWNGGYNNNFGNGVFYQDFSDCSQLSLIPLRINCANICLNKNDFDNTMANQILSLNENGANCIEVSNLELFEYLKQEYSHYEFVFSKEADLLYPITSEVINIIIDQGGFKLISVPEYRAADIEDLNKIKDRSLIELAVNASCNSRCIKYIDCKIHEHTAQYNYSGVNNFLSCPEHLNYERLTPLISIDDIIHTYLPMGINHFSLSEVINGEIDDLAIFMINYFIKDEFKSIVYEMMINGRII